MAKKITLYSLLTVFALILSYLEGLSLSFIPVPGFKLGLANGISMILLSKRKYGGAIAVNITRILLSSLLFGNFYSLLFSLAGGILSSLIVLLFLKMPCFSFAGASTAAGAAHNLAQITVAILLLQTTGLIYLLPILLLSGAVTGFILGIFVNVFSKKYGYIIEKITN